MRRVLKFILLIFILVSLLFLVKANELFAIFDFTSPEQGRELFNNPLPLPSNQNIEEYDFNESRDTIIYVTHPENNVAVGSVHEYNLITGQDKNIVTRNGGNPGILITNSPNSYYLYFSHANGSQILRIENHIVVDEYPIINSPSYNEMNCEQLFLKAKRVQKLFVNFHDTPNREPSSEEAFYLITLDNTNKIAKSNLYDCKNVPEDRSISGVENIPLKTNISSSLYYLNVNQNMVVSSEMEQFKIIHNPYSYPNCPNTSGGFGIPRCYSYDIYFRNKHQKIGRFFIDGHLGTKSGYFTTFDNRLLALYQGTLYSILTTEK